MPSLGKFCMVVETFVRGGLKFETSYFVIKMCELSFVTRAKGQTSRIVQCGWAATSFAVFDE